MSIPSGKASSRQLKKQGLLADYTPLLPSPPQSANYLLKLIRTKVCMATRPHPMVRQRLVRMLIGSHAIDLINVGAHAIVLINIGAHAIDLFNFGYHVIDLIDFGYHAIHLYLYLIMFRPEN